MRQWMASPVDCIVNQLIIRNIKEPSYKTLKGVNFTWIWTVLSVAKVLFNKYIIPELIMKKEQHYIIVGTKIGMS